MSYGDTLIGTPWKGYYITAYGIAVKHGFKGTEEEWLETLKGKDGAEIEVRYNSSENRLEWKRSDSEEWSELLSLEDLQTEIVAQTITQAEEAKTGAETAKTNAEKSAQEASGSAQAAANSAQSAQEAKVAAETASGSAQAAAGAASSSAETATSAAENAEGSAGKAKSYETAAEDYAKTSESWAVGGTGTREGENVNNAMYWAEQAHSAAGGGVTSFNGRTGPVQPQAGDYNAEMVGSYNKETIDEKINSAGKVKTVAGVSPDEAGNVPLTAKNIGAASEGYGLGEYARVAGTDLNSNIFGGWYVFLSSAINTPFESGKLLVIPYSSNSNYTTQIAFSTDAYRSIAVRSCSNGTWGPWEWINPPMLLGLEYRTTERYKGKPVYSKYLSLGSWADKKTVEHGIENIQNVVRYQAFSGGAIVPNIYNHDLSDNWCRYIGSVDATSVYMECGNNVVGNSAAIVMYYTKTTD